MSDAPSDEPAVRARDVVKRYGNLTAVDGLDLDVERGLLFGVLGPNGAGKTSTMKMLYGASRPTSGSLEVLGIDVGQRTRDLKRRLGVVPQDTGLDEDLTPLEVLMVHARFFGLSRVERRQRAAEQLDFFHLSEKASAPIMTLSGGMKRRLLVARALMSRPELLIIDEPTTGLDPQARHVLWNRLRQLRERGVTMILSTHYMDEAERLCDRLVIMDGGRVLIEGRPRDLIEREVGREVLEVEFGAERVEAAAAAARQRGAETELADGHLVCYATDAEDLLHHLHQVDLVPREARLRMATLEDVFLRKTGRSLDL